MDRRLLMKGLAAVAGSAVFSRAANAYQNCMPHPMFGQVCEAGVSLPHIAQAYDTQQQTQWCWAASIEMIFRFYGYNVPQPAIVQQTYGAVTNMPAVTGYVISQNLNRNWVDQNGKHFHVQIEGLYDADAVFSGSPITRSSTRSGTSGRFSSATKATRWC
jgi:hypothetical protein